MTGLIADAIYLDSGNYLEEEQKGCIRKRLGIKDQLLINKTIPEDAKRRQRNLSMAWIDYQKAFDSVPQWRGVGLKTIKLEDSFFDNLKKKMPRWVNTVNQ